MIRIGLISDTHGWLDPEVQKHFAQCDEIWHAGDIGDLNVLHQLQSFKQSVHQQTLVIMVLQYVGKRIPLNVH